MSRNISQIYLIFHDFQSIFRYGLIKPHKPSTRLLAFASDSDSDDEPAKKKISIAESSTQKRQARIMQEDALKEDPTIFQYDEVYDEINTTREEAKKAKTTENRQSKYISRLLVTAEKRKLEFETRLERKVQKEREAEGDKFKDKEVFVTAAYREKLEAMKKAEEEAQREEYLEGIGDVRKQNDLSGFYRHVYEQTVGNDKKETKLPEEKPAIKKIDDKLSQRRKYRKHSDHENSDEDDEQSTSVLLKNEGDLASKKVHLQSNLDADSDFSIDSSDSEDDEKKENDTKTEKSEKEEESTEQTGQTKPDEQKEIKQQGEKAENGQVEKTDNDVKDSNDDKRTDDVKMPPPIEIKPKIDIWKKRTVGDVFLAAVKRYYERKQASG